METILALISASLVWSPLIFAFLLIISGFGLPISEDALVIGAGVLAAKNPELAVFLYAGILIGAYLGDALTYWLGRIFGTKLLETRFWKGKVSPEKLDKFSLYFSKNAYLVILLGRFIPFGIRIFIYLTAGFTKFSYKKFAFIDLLAVSLTTGITFSLSYNFGDEILEFLNQAKYILLAIILIYLIFLLAKKFLQKPSKNAN